MSATITVSISEADKTEVSAKIRAKLDEIVSNASTALYEGGELLATACQEEAPVVSGALQDSISVTQVSDTEVTVAPGVEYAYWVEFGEWEPGSSDSGGKAWAGNPYMKRGVERSRSEIATYIKGRLAQT
jgi:hypothetical protein